MNQSINESIDNQQLNQSNKCPINQVTHPTKQTIIQTPNQANSQAIDLTAKSRTQSSDPSFNKPTNQPNKQPNNQ